MNWSLSGSNWKLMGHWPYAPVLGNSMETGVQLRGVTDWLPAQVPGSVQADLLRAGLIDDPEFASNSLLCEWVEHRWWQYQTQFRLPDGQRAERIQLVFDGVDYAARFYLNGTLLGRHEGMFAPAAFDITALVDRAGENRLDVLVESAPKEHSQLGHTSESCTQKARFGYKWDFSTRLVNLGLWQDVHIDMTGPMVLRDVQVTTGHGDGRGTVRVRAYADGLCGRSDGMACAVLHGHGANLALESPIDPASGRIDLTFDVNQPALWHANGQGGQPLYELTLTASDGNGPSDIWSGKVGIRMLRFVQNASAPDGALPYTLEVNNEKLYIRGVNMVPLSHLYGELRRADYERALVAAKSMGVNLIRVWGGGLIETEAFYQLCDELGLLVWQEFIQSSSGVDNIPSKDPKFLALLKESALQAVKTRRNHASLACWSGGNELMDAQGVPVRYGDENITMLMRIISEHDPDRLFLPSSASGPSEFLDVDHPGRNHDVHGNWQYEGIDEHYRRFNLSDSMLHSEFGAEALSSLDALSSILPPEDLARPVSMDENLHWRHHGEWWDTFRRDTDLFGPIASMESWPVLSQFVQAEALRYALEANRRRKYQNSGSIIWQLNEPWTNASCTCLLEHQGRPKMAYYQVKKAFAQIALSLRYDSLICPPGKPVNWSLYLHSARGAAGYHASVKVFDLAGTEHASAAFDADAPQNAAALLGAMSFSFAPAEGGVLIARLTLTDDAGATVFTNDVLFAQERTHPFSSMQRSHAPSLRVVCNGDEIELINDGPGVALFAHVLGDAELLFEDLYFCLLPGEARSVRALRGPVDGCRAIAL